MNTFVETDAMPENLVLAAPEGTFPVLEAGRRHPRQMKFTECDVDPTCVPETKSRLILSFARYVANNESHESGYEQYSSSFKVYVKAADLIKIKSHLFLWQATEGFSTRKKVPTNILHPLSTCNGVGALLHPANNVLTNKG